MEEPHELWTMFRKCPKHEKQHRNHKIHHLDTGESHVSITEREDDHDKLSDREYESECYRRDTPDLIGSYEDAYSRYLVEEPSCHIGLRLAFEDRVDIAYHRRCYESRREE
jgi:hypothetical protein